MIKHLPEDYAAFLRYSHGGDGETYVILFWVGAHVLPARDTAQAPARDAAAEPARRVGRDWRRIPAA